MTKVGFAINVIYKDGREEYLKEGLGSTPARFSSREDAGRQIAMRMGIDRDVKSLNVVSFPAGHCLPKPMKVNGRKP